MKKGLLFLIVVSALFWGIYYTKDIIVPKKQEGDISGRMKAPTETAEGAARQANRHLLETSIEIFRQREKRYPDSLQELVKKEYLSEIPDSGSSQWEYNPDTGRIK